MPFSQLLGNDPAKAALMRMAEHKRMPNTLLFTGLEGVGKGLYALALTRLLMGPSHAHKLQRANHPDLHLFYPEGKSQLHPIESIRQLIDEVGMPPFEAPVKVFIIHDAHRMLPASSNALLKTLEEPSENSYLILLTDEPEALLPTILSRCCQIPFFPVSSELIAQYVESEFGKSSLEARKIAFLAQGSVARACEIAKRSQDDQRVLIQQILSCAPTDYSRFLKLCTELEEVSGLKKEEEEQAGVSTRCIDRILEEIAAWYRDRHLLVQGADVSFLYHQEAIDLLQASAKQKLPPLEQVLNFIGRSRLGFQRHIKLRTILEDLLLNCLSV